MQSRMFEFETTCSMLIKENEMLRIKTDDLEDRSRCNNIRITILLEKAEGSRPTVFITQCLTEFWIRSVCHTARVLKYQNKMLIFSLHRRQTISFTAIWKSISSPSTALMSPKGKSQLRSAGYPYRMFFPHQASNLGQNRTNANISHSWRSEILQQL
ncbi:hypothetical protein ILYODFUR_030859 [Ilyodon furcidens]|uniref:Uncharacterized protein n=1 Tax=Ilyodon furcidens TaxID=33524 RepID=A0ABV0UPG2_9TELE